MKKLNKHSEVPKPVAERPESEKQRMRRLLKEFFDQWDKQFHKPGGP